MKLLAKNAIAYIAKMLKSKTVWLGIVQVVTALGMFFTGDANMQELLLAPTGILTIIFRSITSEPLDNK